jgi:xylulokinase
MLASVRLAIAQAVQGAGVSGGSVLGLSVSAQRASVACLGSDGSVLRPILSWQDERGGPLMGPALSSMGLERYRLLTGLPIHPVFTLGKLLWLRQAEPDVFVNTAKFALVHDLVLGNLGCTDVVTDRSNASLTGLLDLASGEWCRSILDAAGVSRSMLPDVVDSGTVVGHLGAEAARAIGLLEGTPLVAGGGDHQCAGLGAGAIDRNVVEVTIGTTAVALAACEKPAPDLSGALTCGWHALPGSWEIEGLQSAAGSALAWLGTLIGPDRTTGAAFDDLVAMSPVGSRGVVFLPHLVGGSSAPRWNPAATGAFLGLTASCGPQDLARALVEGICFETRQVLEAMEHSGVSATEIRLTGGISRLKSWRRVLAESCGVPVVMLANPEASLAGAAILAAAGGGGHGGIREAVAAMVRPCDAVFPEAAVAERYATLAGRYRKIGDACDSEGFYKTVRHGLEGE